jgi:hypothetical protein
MSNNNLTYPTSQQQLGNNDACRQPNSCEDSSCQYKILQAHYIAETELNALIAANGDSPSSEGGLVKTYADIKALIDGINCSNHRVQVIFIGDTITLNIASGYTPPSDTQESCLSIAFFKGLLSCTPQFDKIHFYKVENDQLALRVKSANNVTLYCSDLTELYPTI